MANKRSKKDKAAHGSKSDFVRAHAGVGAVELVALAKKEGVTLTQGHIYNIRAQDKKRAAKNGGATNGATAVTNGATKARATKATTGGPEESQLRALVLRIGLDRAEAVIAKLKDL
jgi:hypothetical protein